jgi:hypothetical protein
VDKRIQVTHVKKYSIPSMLKTDFLRAVGMIKILINDTIKRMKSNTTKPIKDAPATTVPRGYILGIPLALISFLFLINCVIFKNLIFLPLAILFYIAILGVNMGFLAFVRRIKGTLFFIKSCILIFTDQLIVGVGIIYGIGEYISKPKVST